MKWLGGGEGDAIIKAEMDRGPHRTQDDAAVGYIYQRGPDPEFPPFGPKQQRWAGDEGIIDNHDQKWKYPTVNSSNKIGTSPGGVSYIGGAATAAAAMPALYDMGGQSKQLAPEQQFVYMPNQLAHPQAGMTLHHPPYLPPHGLAQQLHDQMRHQQSQTGKIFTEIRQHRRRFNPAEPVNETRNAASRRRAHRDVPLLKAQSDAEYRT
ncbi:unnamed protein product [Phyllotreta striolata]|uniref:Uncharacterized protein n=1 Tax=Phyllotreta striolata TaxID=444603 RepID=A0A9N9TFQ5_PHYSR|nr:unnamed protein product [Phyllotreta striolata]